MYFVAPEKIHGERNIISGGIKPKPLIIITCATKNNKQNHIVILVVYLLMDVPEAYNKKQFTLCFSFILTEKFET